MFSAFKPPVLMCTTCRLWKHGSCFTINNGQMCNQCAESATCITEQISKWLPNKQLYIFLVSRYIRKSRPKVSEDSEHELIPVDILRLCLTFMPCLTTNDRWEYFGDSQIKFDCNNTKLIVLQTMYNRKTVPGTKIISVL